MAFDILGTSISLITFFGIYLILALSLNLEYGFSGQLNLGKVLFYSIGAYTSGAIAGRLLLFMSGSAIDPMSWSAVDVRMKIATENPSLILGIFVLSLAVSAIIGGAAGYFASYPGLKLRPEYTGIALLISSEMVRGVVYNYPPIAGGIVGLAGIPNPFVSMGDGNAIYGAYALLVLGIAIATFILVEKMINSPYGRMLKAIRDDDLASATLGKEVRRVRALTLMLGSALAAVAGGLYAYYSSYVIAADFITARTFDVWVIVILGGTANNRGVVVGAAVVTIIDRLTTVFRMELLTWLGLSVSAIYIRYIMIGVIFILVLMYRPLGLFSERPLKTAALETIAGEKDDP